MRGTRRRGRRRGVRRAVHPRVCGELRSLTSARNLRHGSSPRVRGTRLGRLSPPSLVTVHPRVCGELAGALVHVDADLRFIPACAGNSFPSLARRCLLPVHPRVCGELVAPTAVPLAIAGSSPRVRGTPQQARQGAGGGRFIPACAGNSANLSHQTGGEAVHPRVCGELRRIRWQATRNVGSSPRVRGTLRRHQHGAYRRRFIPACAGNSRTSLRRHRAAPVHPRVCGELVFTGASPIVGAAVHPRVCGELVPVLHEALPQAGSSPRVRGTRRIRVGRELADRFIPACAGNSQTHRHHAVHGVGSSPRVRGTHLVAKPRRPRRPGSSPRVRGTRDGEAEIADRVRFIPACAGNSQERRPARRRSHGSSPRVRGTRCCAPARGR